MIVVRSGYSSTYRVLTSSGVAASVTGTLAETTLATISIPANTLGPKSAVRVTSLWGCSAINANAKTCRIRYDGAAGTAIVSSSIVSNLSMLNQQHIFVRPTTQISGHIAGQGGWGTATSAPLSVSVAYASASSYVLTGQLANVGDTLTLEAYLFEYWYEV